MFIGTINDLYGENYILVEAVTNDLNSTFSYMVRVDFYNPALATQPKNIYVPANGGHIDYEYVRDTKGTVKLKWSPVLSLLPSVSSTNSKTNPAIGSGLSGVRYKLVFSDSQDAIMDSVCAIKSGQSEVFTVYDDVDGDNLFETQLPRGQEVQFNVIAIVDQA